MLLSSAAIGCCSVLLRGLGRRRIVLVSDSFNCCGGRGLLSVAVASTRDHSSCDTPPSK